MSRRRVSLSATSIVSATVCHSMLPPQPPTAYRPRLARSSAGIVELSMKKVVMPRLLKEMSPARIGCRVCDPNPVKSLVAWATNSATSAMAVRSSNPVASRHPGESQFTWQTQLRRRSLALVSAYHVEPA